MSEQEPAEAVVEAVAQERTEVKRAGSEKRPFAGWLFAEATIGLSLFSCILVRPWSQLHWELGDAKRGMSQEAYEVVAACFNYLGMYKIIALLAVAVFLVGICFRPRRASLVALPFALIALLVALFRQ